MFLRVITKQQRLAATLVVCLLYQMGACPCGCLEHNYWLQAIGVSDEHDGEYALNVRDDTSVSSQHDCDGGRALLYVDNSLTHERDSTLTVRGQSAATYFPALLPQIARILPQDRGPPDGQRGRSHCAVLQVFLI